MKGVDSEHLKMAYKVVLSVNNGSQVCTPQRFAMRAFMIYKEEIEKYPYLLTLLDRALRKLPSVHPDVKRVAHGEYVLKSHEKACETDALRRKVGRCGGFWNGNL